MTNPEVAFKVRENRLRRVADRQGLHLVKCRRRDPNAMGYGFYGLINNAHGGCDFGGSLGWFDATLDEIEAYLTQPVEEPERPAREIPRRVRRSAT